MAKIKGLWQFNEVIVPPTQEIDQDLTYTFPEPPDSDFSHGIGIKFLPVGDGRVYFFYINIAGGTVSSPVYYQDAWRKQGWRTIDFGLTEQEVSDEFYAQMTANATSLDEPETPDTETEELPGGTTITYDGGTIAAVVSGGVATLKCAGLKMKTDITVKAAEGGVNLPSYDGTITVDEEVIPLELALQEKTVTVTEDCELIPAPGCKGFSKVIINVADKDVEEYDGRMVIV